MPIPMSSPESAPPAPDAAPAPEGKSPAAGLDAAVAAVGQGMQKIVDALAGAGVPPEVQDQFKAALAAYAGAAQSLVGGADAGAEPQEMESMEQGGNAGAKPMSMQGM